MKHRRVTNIVTARLIAKNALSAIILFFSKVQIDFQFISLSCPEAHQTSSEKPVCLVSPAGAEQCRWNIYNILSLGSSHPARWCRPAQTRECASQWSASIIPQNQKNWKQTIFPHVAFPSGIITGATVTKTTRLLCIVLRLATTNNTEHNMS